MLVFIKYIKCLYAVQKTLLQRVQLKSILFCLITCTWVSTACAEEILKLGPSWQDRTAYPFSTPSSKSAPPLAKDLSSYSYGDPSIAEQVHLEEINRARMNPLAEAARFNIALNEGLPDNPISATPAQPLTMNGRLSLAARNHSRDMIVNDYFAHNSQDGTTPFERIVAAGYSYWTAGENLAWKGSTGVLDEIDTVIVMHKNLFIDKNTPSRGHRINIFAPAFKEIGIGVHAGPYRIDETVYTSSFMLTCDFAASSDYQESFLLGVVFDDDDDLIYEAGEGMGGIEIKVYKAGSLKGQTITASAGGYALPLEDGAYLVRASETETKYAEKNVTIGGFNKKIDFLRDEFIEYDPQPVTGDFDNDQDVDLADAILGLQIITNQSKGKTIPSEVEVNSDGVIGLADIIYVLKMLTK